MLIAADMAADVLSQMALATDPATANTIFGNAIANHIKANAELLFAWSAALPGPPWTVDPQVTATGEITVLTFNITPSMQNTQALAMNHVKGEFIAGLTAAFYNITEAGFATAPGAMASSPNLANLVITVNGATPILAMTQFCQCIIDWVTSQAPAAPCAGTHGPYVGAGTVTTIS